MYFLKNLCFALRGKYILPLLLDYTICIAFLLLRKISDFSFAFYEIFTKILILFVDY